MPLSRAVLERQLKQAEQTLANRVQALQSSGKTGDACTRDPQWRSAQAACTSLRRRLAAVAAVEANNAEVERRKLEPKPEPEEKPAKAKEKTKDKAKAEQPAPKPKKAKSDAKAAG